MHASAMLDKYKKLSTQIKASFWFLICAFLQKSISFITTPIFTRLLTTAEYGQYNVFNSWMGILSVIVTLNLYYGVYARGLVTFESERNEFSSSLQGLTLTLVAAWMAVCLLFSQFWNQLTGLTTLQMLLMLQMMWTTAVFSFWSCEQRVDLKYRKLVLVTVIVSIAKPILGIVFVNLSEDRVTARIFAIALVELIAYTGFFFVQIYRGKRFFSAKFWKHALVFNIPLIPHYLSSSILNSADRIMIDQMVGQSEAGIYGLAYSISMIMTMFNTALTQTIEPWLYKKIHTRRIQDIGQVAYPSMILIAVVNILLIAFSPEIISIFAPNEYYDAIYVIPPVAMSSFFMSSYSFFAVFEFYYQRTKLIALATSVGAILNIVLNYIFIKIYGYYAAGYTTLVCYILYAVFHYIAMMKTCKNKFDGQKPYSIAIYAAIMGVFLALGFLLLFTYRFPWLRYALILIFAVILILKRKLIVETLRLLGNLRDRSTRA